MARQRPDIQLIVHQTVILACLLCGACSGNDSSHNTLQVTVSNAQSAEPGVPSLAVARAGLPRVLVLGDSIAAGRYLSEQQAFPRVLEQQLRALGRSVVLVNASAPEDTTADGLRRIAGLLREQPKVVLVALGENDKSQGVSAREVGANLRAILSKVRAAGAQALLLGVSSEPVRGSNSLEASAARAYAQELAELYPRLAAESSVTFVPYLQGVAGHRELTLPDGVHPTPEGHERIADHLIDPLRLLLSQ